MLLTLEIRFVEAPGVLLKERCAYRFLRPRLMRNAYASGVWTNGEFLYALEHASASINQRHLTTVFALGRDL